MTGHEIRKTFLKYFESKNHKIVRSSSLIPENDPTLLFTNAGMVQFKDVFLGKDKRDYTRATSSQKCVRAGGKHNDLENVGKTSRHHTFFEMLGNFSFGDYFKKDAIAFAWELITKVFSLPPKDLWITIYKDDDEAYELWRKIAGISSERIVRMGEKDNFWSMGETGPCGPCSEIIIDQGRDMGCKKDTCAVGCDCDRFLEIWNLVFMQYERKTDGAVVPLPKPNIDTGMGLERITAVMQGVKSNFETDLFTPIIQRIEELSGKEMNNDSGSNIIPFRAIADHARAMVFLISDGVLPSNEGRGYVLRRLIRRASRYGFLLNISSVFLHKIASSVIDVMCDVYPEILNNANFISSIITKEEEKFTHTLSVGMNLLDELCENLKKKNKRLIPGNEIFKLYDTYGFPIDIINDIASERGFDTDMPGFYAAMEKQKERARKAWVGSGETRVLDVYKELSNEYQIKFVGYDKLESKGKICAILKDSHLVERVFEGDTCEIITSETPFYGERGGQIGDTGIIVSHEGKAEITATIIPYGNLIVHKAKILSGSLSTGNDVVLTVDKEKRVSIAANHTATHLLHSALKEVLGDHVKQAGSLVGDKKLRFDFTHYESLSTKEVEKIEEIVNKKISEGIPVKIKATNIDKALNEGAIALFEEKYGEIVRVVSINEFSKELCGGTHVSNTSNIGFFKIISESSVAAGIRRIEALTGTHALKYVQEIERLAKDAASKLQVSISILPEKITQLIDTVKKQENELEKLKNKFVVSNIDNILKNLKNINGINVVSAKVDNISQDKLRHITDLLRSRLGSGVIVLGSVYNGRVILVSSVTNDLVNSLSLDASKIIKKVAAIVGGGGGGKSQMALAGGKKVEMIDNALEAVFNIVEGFINNKDR